MYNSYKISKSINPFSQSVIAEHRMLTDIELERKLQEATLVFGHWRQTSFQDRADKMKALACILRRDKESLGLLISSEMGKILPEALAEIEKSADNCDYYAQNAEQMLKDIYHHTAFKSLSVYEPQGAVFGIMPWNYPFWQVFRYAAPIVMSGNVTLLKHAPNVIGCAKAIEAAFLEAGFPKGVFQQLHIDIDRVEAVIAADIVSGLSFTGSQNGGASVAALAGKHIKKSVLELGGSDAFVVLQDADLEKAAAVAVQSRMLNAGQACICAKRFIVVEKVAEEFIFLFADKLRKLKQGDPLQAGIDLGPMARLDLAKKLSSQLQQSLSQGARLLYGGERDLCNFQPALIDLVAEHNSAFIDETFGPLAAVVRASDEADAIRLVNANQYGLAAALWTADVEKAFDLARKIDTGNVFVNSLVRSDSRIPFGGTKQSGYGRELAKCGITEFMNMKSIVLE